MSKLLVRANTNGRGLVHDITPQSAGWRYVGFALRDLPSGDVLDVPGAEHETCIVVLSGDARITAGEFDTGVMKGRASVFDRTAPNAVYLPGGARWSVEASTDVELAVCSAPAGARRNPPRRIDPAKMPLETRGVGTNTRHVCNILPESEPADSLLVVEVVTPAGNWSSYPPHKHDTDDLPNESLLEETYYHRVNPPQGYVLHRVYDDSRELDETMAAEDRSVVLVPRGYHPVGAPHGYESYYLNVMAGPKRIWKFRNDPNHEWMLK